MVPAGVSSGYEQTRQNAAFVEMRGSEVFKVAVTTLKDMAEQILAANQMTVADVDWADPASGQPPDSTADAKRLGLPEERMVDCVRTHGNTSGGLAAGAGWSQARWPHSTRPNVVTGRFQGGFTLGALVKH